MLLKNWSLKPSHICWLIIVMGCVLRIWGIQTQSLWNDEGASYLLARLPWPELKTMIETALLTPPIWYLLCKFFLWFSPENVWLIRLPSLIASCLTLYLIVIWLKNRVNEKAAIYASLLFAVSPMAILYTHEGRNYALIAFAFTLSLVATDHFLQEGQKRSLTLSALAMVFLLYLHGISGVFWVSLNLYVAYVFFVEKKLSMPQLRQWLIAQFAILLCFSPWLPTFLSHNQYLKESITAIEVWKGLNPISAIYYSMFNLIPGGIGNKTHVPIPHVFHGAKYLLLTLPLLFFMAKPWKKRAHWPRFLIAFFTPLILISVYSEIFSPAYHIGRSESVVMPIFFVFLGYLLGEVKKPKLLACAFSLLFVATGSIALTNYHFSSQYPRKQWSKQAAPRVFSSDNQPDFIIVDKDTRPSLAAYIAATATQYPKDLKAYVYPDTKPDAIAKWNHHFMVLNRSPKPKEEAIEEANEKLNAYLNANQPEHITVVFPQALTRGKYFRWGYMDQLIRTLKKDYGYAPMAKLETFPMDWRANGFHSILRLRRKR